MGRCACQYSTAQSLFKRAMKKIFFIFCSFLFCVESGAQGDTARHFGMGRYFLNTFDTSKIDCSCSIVNPELPASLRSNYYTYKNVNAYGCSYGSWLNSYHLACSTGNFSGTCCTLGWYYAKIENGKIISALIFYPNGKKKEFIAFRPPDYDTSVYFAWYESGKLKTETISCANKKCTPDFVLASYSWFENGKPEKIYGYYTFTGNSKQINKTWFANGQLKRLTVSKGEKKSKAIELNEKGNKMKVNKHKTKKKLTVTKKRERNSDGK